MSNPNEIAEVLDKAAQVIETDGWCRGTYQNGAGHVCAVGAIRQAATGDPRAFHVGREAGLARAALRREVGAEVTTWNDAQRDRRKVVRAFRRTARKIRQGLISV